MTEAPYPGYLNSRLLDALVTEGLISEADREAVAVQARAGQLHIEEAIIRMGLIPELELLRFQASYYRVHFVSTKKLASAKIHASLLKLVPHDVASTYCLFPVKYDAKAQELSFLMVEPDDDRIRRALRDSTRVPTVRALVARPAAIQAAIRLHYEGQASAFEQIKNTLLTEFPWRPHKKKYLA